MTWSTPLAFVTGQVVTAAQMNTYISDNLSHLGSMTVAGTALSAKAAGSEISADIRSARAAISANVDRTGATSFANVTGVQVSPNAILTNVIFVICTMRVAQLTLGNGQWQLVRSSGDGTFQTQASRTVATGNGADLTIFGRNTGHTSGSKTFDLQQATDNSGGTARTERAEILAIAM